MFFKKKQGWKTRLPVGLIEIKSELKKRQHAITQNDSRLSKKDKELLKRISMKTKQMNVNNVTRTKAYLDFYLNYPEIHWAFLGHMVSRNGGWNMTDLRGDLLSRLMNEKTVQDFFSFLERGNWLIFQDAYPQFLLYAESKRKNQNLFYLLPFLNVSIFMEVIWNHFWKTKDRNILTIGLIINEQNYLEQRILQNSIYKEKVIYTLEFFLQDLLSLNHILFPLEESGKLTLIGLTLHHFDSLHERIILGKRLYRLLFQSSGQLKKVLQWAINHAHTGSRKDYWQDIFNDVNEGVPGISLKRRLIACRLRKGANRLYSPRLEYAWKNVQHSEAENSDWFSHLNVINYLHENQGHAKGEIVNEYCETIEKLEIATITKKAIFL
ncbi:DUF2515 family protein [Lederbergia lenta]|uniref:DUF2515 family protein n=1 Tax=Lederbergia lenta TaxID=1467 RepID=UPI003D816ED9